MTMDIGLLKLAGAMASHAAHRQGLIAENLANADTPGYHARDLESFATVATRTTQNASVMKATRPEHIGFTDTMAGFAVEDSAVFSAESPNGNTVSIDDQMMRSAALKVDHDLALGIYSKSLQILRLGLGRR